MVIYQGFYRMRIVVYKHKGKNFPIYTYILSSGYLYM